MQNRTKKRIAISATAAVITLVALLAAVGSDGVNAEQVGYFKSSLNSRVVSYKSTDPVSEADARQLLNQLPWTPGQPTIAVIYEGDAQAPADGVTLAQSAEAATSMIFDPPFNRWTWRMIISPSGRRALDHQQCPTDSTSVCGEIQNIFVKDPS